MAKVYGLPGEWARVRGTVYGMWPLFLGSFIGGAAVAMLCFGRFCIAMILLIAVAVFIRFALKRTYQRIERFFKGARGEERVSEILRSLPDTYRVYNDFVACGQHIDHVVVGPAGIYAVETKFWRGKVTIEDDHILLDGQLPDRSPIKQALNEAALVRDEMKRFGWERAVTPVLVFASDTFALGIAEVRGTAVMNSCELANAFAGSRAAIDDDELTRLFAMLEDRK